MRGLFIAGIVFFCLLIVFTLSINSITSFFAGTSQSQAGTGQGFLVTPAQSSEKLLFSLKPPICTAYYGIEPNGTVSFFNAKKEFVGTGFVSADKKSVFAYGVKNQVGFC